MKQFSMGIMMMILFMMNMLVVLGLECKSDSNDDVSWWIMIKAPTLSDGADGAAKSGYGYSYMDANGEGELSWTGKYLNESDNALAYTLSQVYEGSSSDMGWLFYNDQDPDGNEHESNGHTKGCLAFTSESAFWLVHSVPRFPPYTKDSYQFPSDETDYGQSFLCVSTSASTANGIAHDFLLTKPYVFDNNLPSSLNSTYYNVNKVLNEDWNTTAGTGVNRFETSSSQDFIHLYKNSEWNQELYEDLVAPYFKENLYVESWMNGVDPLPSYCKPQYPYDVMDVRNVSLADNVTWNETKDHSKWCITTNSDGYTCIGDINRQASQAGRGGGTVCYEKSNVWDSFNKMIQNADSCSD